MSEEEEASEVDRLMEGTFYSTESPASSDSEVVGMPRFVTDSQSSKVKLIPRTFLGAEQGSRSSRKNEAPLLLAIPPRTPTTRIQTQMNDKFPFVGVGMRHTMKKKARVFHNCRMIQPICPTRTPRPLQPLPRLVATNKHCKGQSFCRLRRVELIKSAMPTKNCAASYLSPR